MRTQAINLKAPELRAPTVDIVFPCEDADLELVFERRVRKLIGALQRRFWERRRQMLQARALGTDELANSNEEHGATSGLLTDLSEPLLDWDARVSEYKAVIDEASVIDVDAPAPAIRIRGWNQTEAGILVDGRAATGCIVDLAVALTHSADMLRQGHQALMIHIPAPADQAEAKLWTDLLNVAQDRLGVERGTIGVVVDGEMSLDDVSHFEAVA